LIYLKFDIITKVAILSGEENEGFFDNDPNPATTDTFALLSGDANGIGAAGLPELVLAC
jgi:hypothetical protein